MNSNQREMIKEEINNHIRMVKEQKTFAEVLGFGESKKLLGYMQTSPTSQKFFSNTDVESLLQQYESEISRVSQTLGGPQYTTKQKILNYLEYIRLNGMYENLATDDSHWLSSLSQSGINIALLGKGVCASQAKFLRDLIGEDEQSVESGRVSFYDKENDLITEEHEIVYCGNQDSSNRLFLDPTWYTGSIESMEGSLNSAYISEDEKLRLSTLDVTQQDIEQARNVAQDYLIQRFGIDDISNQLGLAEVGDLEKQIRILTFMEQNLAPASEPLLTRSVMLGNREVEVGKLLELFYRANNVPYTFECPGDKRTTRYAINIDGQQCIIQPKFAFHPARNNNMALTKKMFYTKDENGEYRYLQDFSQEKLQEMGMCIRKSREIAEKVIIPEEKLDITPQEERKSHFSEQQISTFIQDVSASEIKEETEQNKKDKMVLQQGIEGQQIETKEIE